MYLFLPQDDDFDGMAGFDDVAAPGEESDGPPMEIVDFDELLNSKTVEVQHNQGLTAVATVPITRLDEVGGLASSRPTFLMQHLYVAACGITAGAFYAHVHAVMTSFPTDSWSAVPMEVNYRAQSSTSLTTRM